MDVYLLVYDLSRGLARQMSTGLLGFRLDAVYHTSIQLNGLEYVYDGNVVAIRPGSSHLGQPMQKLHLGRTELPMDVIEEYLDSLREVYTVEAYDLWRHNCNNFSNDLAMFLLGKAIPDHITNMPQDVLDSPFGQLLMPTLNQQVNASRRAGGILGIQEQTPGSSVKPQSQLHHRVGRVRVVSSLGELDQMLDESAKSCAVVFFTSATCPPCKTLYPLYDELAAEFGEKATLIKVDISQAFDVGSRYSVSATPTFITFLQGQQENRWSGADPSALRGNIQLLVQMAWPPHPHQALDLPSFSNLNVKPVVFPKIPPLPKLLAKMGPTATNPAIQSLKHFIETRSSQGPAEATLPDMDALTALVRESLLTLPPDLLFALIDLLRCGLVDPRLSGCLAEEPGQHTVASILEHVSSLSDASKCPYALRLVTQLVASSFVDDAGGGGRSSVRVAAASLLFNVALANGRRRRDGPGDALPEADQVELAASALEAIAREEASAEALEGVLLALGHLAYRLPLDGELAELLRAMDAAEVVLAKEKAFPRLGLVREVGAELLGKGLVRA